LLLDQTGSFSFAIATFHTGTPKGTNDIILVVVVGGIVVVGCRGHDRKIEVL
jgi:hypothetical protein